MIEAGRDAWYAALIEFGRVGEVLYNARREYDAAKEILRIEWEKLDGKSKL